MWYTEDIILLCWREECHGQQVPLCRTLIWVHAVLLAGKVCFMMIFWASQAHQFCWQSRFVSWWSFGPHRCISFVGRGGLLHDDLSRSHRCISLVGNQGLLHDDLSGLTGASVLLAIKVCFMMIFLASQVHQSCWQSRFASWWPFWASQVHQFCWPGRFASWWSSWTSCGFCFHCKHKIL